MPLLDIPANAVGLKRSHEDFVADVSEMTQSKLSFAAAVHNPNLSADITPCQIPPKMTISVENLPSSPLTDRTHTPTPPRPCLQTVTPSDPSTPTPAKNTAPPPTGGEPPAKRKCLTTAEKEEKSKAKLDKEQARVAKLAEKAKAEEEKKAKAEEREKEREKKRLEKEQKQQEKERKLQEKEEEQRKVQEAKEKKERSQLKLASFFKAGPSSPAKAIAKGQPTKVEASPSNATPLQTKSQDDAVDSVLEYKKVFQPFFVKEYVKLAPKTFACDEAALLAKSRQLDEYVQGSKDFKARPFTGPDSVEYFCLPAFPRPRGRPYPNVRKMVSILSDASTIASGASAPVDLADSPFQSALQLLREVPMKYLRFFQDVRPAYYGTVTSLPPSLGSSEKPPTGSLHAARLRKLARKPISREVLPLQYDYDSEAEWVDDGDGEDIEGDDDDDDDDEDDEEDMTDFLDNSEDLIKRPVFASGMEPESSGLCFEDARRMGPSTDLAKYRMEFILDNEHKSIDPFSSQYWQPEPGPKTASPALLQPPTAKAVSNAFAALSGPGGKKSAVVPTNMLDEFKHAILKYPKLSKVGLVEVLSAQFDKCTKAQVKNSVEMLAERHDKIWRLKSEHAL